MQFHMVKNILTGSVSQIKVDTFDRNFELEGYFHSFAIFWLVVMSGMVTCKFVLT